MRADGALNLDVIEPYAGWLSANRVAGAFICGTTGEGMSMTNDERQQVAERWVADAPGQLRVIVHVGHNSLGDCQALAAHAQKIGADSIACMAPFFFKVTRVEELVDWCAQVASAAPALPFYYYHMPSMTGVSVPVAAFLAAAAGRIPNLAGIKYTYEDLADFEQCLRFEQGRYDVLFGRDELLSSALALGANGAVGSTYNFAAPLYQRLIEAFNRGDKPTVDGLQARAVEMIDVCVKSGAHPIAAFKRVMRRVGIDCGPVRRPLLDITDAQATALFARLDQIKELNGPSHQPVTAVAGS